MRSLVGFVVLAVSCTACGKVLELSPDAHRDGQAEPGACTTSRQCLATSGPEEPAVCVDGRCTPLLMPPVCPLVLPQSDGLWLESLQGDGPEPLIVGAFSDVHHDSPVLSSAFTYDYDLVLSEVMHTLGGLPVAGAGKRPVLAVVCRNDFDTPEELDSALDHLALDLQVPGILATLTVGDLEHAFERTTDAQVFYMNLRDADPGLIATASDGLMWHMLTGWDSLLPSYQALVDRTVRHWVSTGALAPGEPVRIALVRAFESPEANTLGSTLLEHLVVNGAPLSKNAAGVGGTFRLVDVPSPSDGVEYSYDGFVNELRDFAPHIIIAATGDEIIGILAPLEAHVQTVLPFYVLSPNQIYVRSTNLIHLIDADLYERVAGINFSAAEDARAYNAFQARFDAAYPQMKGAARGTENQYDGPYYLLYAAAAARGSWPLIGADLAVGVRQLLAGAKYTVGPDDLPSATAALKSAGSSIALYGTAGPPNFDPTTGSLTDPGTVWCVDADGVLHTDVLRVTPTGELKGSFSCFDFDD
jgi:hypothetical protein